MEISDTAAAREAADVMAHLRQRVEGLVDGDRVLPADGASLLATLTRALASVNGEDAPAARAGIAAFIGRVKALIGTGTLEAADGRPPIEMAAALRALLRSTDGTDPETRRRRGDSS